MVLVVFQSATMGKSITSQAAFVIRRAPSANIHAVCTPHSRIAESLC